MGEKIRAPETTKMVRKALEHNDTNRGEGQELFMNALSKTINQPEGDRRRRC